jgi:hypothetical protein
MYEKKGRGTHTHIQTGYLVLQSIDVTARLLTRLSRKILPATNFWLPNTPPILPSPVVVVFCMLSCCYGGVHRLNHVLVMGRTGRKSVPLYSHMNCSLPHIEREMRTGRHTDRKIKMKTSKEISRDRQAGRQPDRQIGELCTTIEREILRPIVRMAP